MTKQLKKKFIFKILLLNFIALFFISCNEDDVHKNHSHFNESKSNFKIIKLDKIKDTGVLERIQNPKSIVKNNNRLVFDSINDFSVDIDKAIVIERNNKTSYTFKIIRSDSVNNNYLENLVIAVLPNNIYKSFIYRYNITEDERQTLKYFQYINIENKYEVIPIENTSITSEIAKEYPCFNTDIVWITTYTCPEGNHGADNFDNCWYYQNGLASTSGYWSVSTVLGMCDDGGGDTGDNTGDNADNTSGGVSGDDIIDTVPFEPCNDCPEIDQDGDTNDPCANIKAKTSNNAYKQKFKDLNKPEKFNLNHESGFYERNVSGVNEYVDGVPYSDHTLSVPSDAQNATHVHNNIPLVYDGTTISYDAAIKMLSAGDILTLIKTCQSNNGNAQETFVTMISNDGIFAIQLINPINFTSEIRNKIGELHKYFKSRSKFISDNYNDLTSNERKKYLEKMFLQGLKDKNLDLDIALYEGEIENETDPDINNYNIKWKRKNLKKVFLGYNVVETPCK